MLDYTNSISEAMKRGSHGHIFVLDVQCTEWISALPVFKMTMSYKDGLVQTVTSEGKLCDYE